MKNLSSRSDLKPQLPGSSADTGAGGRRGDGGGRAGVESYITIIGGKVLGFAKRFLIPTALSRIADDSAASLLLFSF